MKYTILGLFAALLLWSSPAVFAASVDEYYNIDERVSKMKSDLNLNDDQVKEIKPIMENYKDKIHEARKEKEDKLDKILTSEQKDKMKNFKEDKDKAEKGWWQF
jgi:Spy/CpxP family protein refolding chaperone